MATLANKAILSGADNRPPMMEKDIYDSWKSRMELYMMNRQHERMVLESVENGPLIWPTIEENGVNRPKKYFELFATEATQADCDAKATNIILQILPPEARLVANGSTQVESVDVDETFSLVKSGTIRTVLSLAISRHWPVHQLDVKNRSLYGLKQAPRAWFQRFAAYIATVGFTPSRCDSSLFIYKHGDDTAFLLLYVDDIVLTASSDPLLQQIIASLHREFSMTDLGISVTRDSSGMFLSQCKYAMEILERAHIVGCNPSRTPVDTESKLRDGGTPVVDPTLYRSLEGSLQCLTFTRPDIAYVGTLDYGLQLFSSTIDSLIAYSDADWAGCPTTRRSTSGYCVFLGNNLLSWSSKRQPTLSRSSAEAEYHGVANAVAETFWIQNLLCELQTHLSSATIVYCDNVSVVYLSSNPVQHQLATGHLCVLHVASRFQYEDIFTKGLPSALFDEFRDSLSVRCTPAPTTREY
nr:copia protein [Tanacetum cinerariifolium]